MLFMSSTFFLSFLCLGLDCTDSFVSMLSPSVVCVSSLFMNSTLSDRVTHRAGTLRNNQRCIHDQCMGPLPPKRDMCISLRNDRSQLDVAVFWLSDSVSFA